MSLPTEQRKISFTESCKNFHINYFKFDGRTSRREFWFVILAQFLVWIAYAVTLKASFRLGIPFLQHAACLTYIPLCLYLIIPNWAIMFRRLHDVNRSGAWALSAFIPILGFFTPFVCLWFSLQKSTDTNPYGPRSKQ